jgi:ribosomal subunit interface protein
VDIIVKGRNVEVPVHYREHVSEKLTRVERYDQKLIRIDVELFHEPNRRQSQTCQRVEITCKSRGPVIRSEACAADFYSALDVAITKLENRLRRAADRRRVHHGRRTPVSVATATATADAEPVDDYPAPGPGIHSAAENRAFEPVDPFVVLAGGGGTALLTELEEDVEQIQALGPGRIVRKKKHQAKPMSVEEALFEMELVGHDFYLFNDLDTGRASVVYLRRGYDYGVISIGV